MKDRMDEAKLVIERINKKTVSSGQIANVSDKVAEMPNSPQQDEVNTNNDKSDDTGVKEDSDDIVMATLTNIQEALAHERKVSNSECCGWGEIFKPTPATRLTLAVGIMVAIMQQITGIETVMVGVGVCIEEYVCDCVSRNFQRHFSFQHKLRLKCSRYHFVTSPFTFIYQYYQPQILRDAGIHKSKTQLLISFTTGFVKLVSIFVAGFLVDNVGGRRLLLMASHTGCMLTLLMVSG